MPEVESKRLSLTISGGGSLGAYEAGAIYELIKALEYHNSNQEDPSKEILIDVLTGASAGAINSFLLCFLLTFRADSFVSAEDNPLFEFWVKDAYMVGPPNRRGLLGSTEPQYSLLNAEWLGTIAEKQLRKYFHNGSSAQPKRHPAAADFIEIGLTLANMTGLDFRIQYLNPQDKTFVYTRYEDEYVKRIEEANSNALAFWHRVKEHAIASGAFPYGLRCREVSREKSEYSPEIDFGMVNWPDASDKADFAFIDGGLFHNQPLGLARSISGKIARESQNPISRSYLYISPWDKKTSISQKRFNADDADHVRLTAQLLWAISNQSRYQDWIKCIENNSKSLKVAKLRDALEKSFNDNAEAAASIMESLSENLARSDDPSLNELGERLRHSDSSEKSARLVADSLSCSQSEFMPLYAITPGEGDELCGDGLLTFKGFFDENWRRHDYEIGRRNARKWIEGMSEDTTLGPITINPAGEPISVDPGSCTEEFPDKYAILAAAVLGRWYSSVRNLDFQ